jgi:hypothetical protein
MCIHVFKNLKMDMHNANGALRPDQTSVVTLLYINAIKAIVPFATLSTLNLGFHKVCAGWAP